MYLVFPHLRTISSINVFLSLETHYVNFKKFLRDNEPAKKITVKQKPIAISVSMQITVTSSATFDYVLLVSQDATL